MRGQDTQQAGMFSGLSPEERVPVTHPLRAVTVGRHPLTMGFDGSCDWVSGASVSFNLGFSAA